MNLAWENIGKTGLSVGRVINLERTNYIKNS